MGVTKKGFVGVQLDSGFIPLNVTGLTLSDANTPKIDTQVSPIVDQIDTDGEMMLWGFDNRFPSDALKLILKNTALSSGMVFLGTIVSSMKLRYGFMDSYDNDGNPVYTFKKEKEVEDFLKISNYSRFIRDFGSEAFRLWNPFCTFYASKDSTKIAKVVMERTKDCRVSKHNDKGRSTKLFLNANFDKGVNKENKSTLTRDLIDVYELPWEEIKEKLKAQKALMAMALSMPETGGDYYQTPPWYSSVESNWYDVAQNIPIIKKHRQEGMNIPRYILYIPYSHFKLKYKDWDKLTNDERKKHVEDEAEGWKQLFTGTDKSGNMVLSMVNDTDQTRKDFSKWELVPLPVDKGNEMLEDSYEATSHIFRSMGFDGTLTGPTPGKAGMGAGSGSNNREAMNVLFTSVKCLAEIALEPLQVVQQVNGWSDDLVFWLDVPYMPTQNQVTTKDRTPESKTV